MTFSAYMKSNIWEYLLVLVSAWSVSVVGMNGFYLDSLSESLGWGGRALLALGIDALLIAVLYACAYRRRRMLVGIAVYAAVLAALVLACIAASTAGNVYVDEEGNYLYLAGVLAASCTACFLLTRTLTGSAIWFVASAFTCSVVQAFYQSEELALSIVASLSALALIVHKNFKMGALKAQVLREPSHKGNFAASASAALGVGCAALLLWSFVIAPLAPGVMDMKLVTDYRRLPIKEVRGTADEHPEFNFDMTTDNLVGGFPYTTDDLKEDPSSATEIDAMSMLQQQEQQRQEALSEASGGGTHDSFDRESLRQEFDVISYSERFPFIVLIIVAGVLLVLAVIAFFVVRRIMRTRRLERMLSKEPAEQVEEMYLDLLGKLSRIGFTVPVGMTLAEYAETSKRSMDMLTEETQVAFDGLTATYCACVYGNHVPTEDEVVPFAAYYLRFWKAACTQLGNFKYFFRSFRL